jgi:hypothetical protein
MSNSRKKKPQWSLRRRQSKPWKRMANRKVRHSKNIPNGNSYKLLFNSWNICDGSWLIFPDENCYNDYRYWIK